MGVQECNGYTPLPLQGKKSHVRALTKGRVVVERAVYILSYRDLLEGLIEGFLKGLRCRVVGLYPGPIEPTFLGTYDLNKENKKRNPRKAGYLESVGLK